MSNLQILNLGGFLLGAAALAVTAAVLFEERPALEGRLGLLSKRQVMPLFAVVAPILFIAVTLGAYAATKAGDFVPQCYAAQPVTSGPLMQLAAVSAYLALEVVTPTSFLLAGYAIDEARIMDRGRWTLAVIGSLLLSLAPVAAYTALRIPCVH